MAWYIYVHHIEIQGRYLTQLGKSIRLANNLSEIALVAASPAPSGAFPLMSK